MATTFPTSTYQLSDRTRIRKQQNVARDMLDDGTPRVRQFSATNHCMVNCVWEYLDGATADALLTYLNTNKVTEFDLVIPFSSPVVTVTGYLWSDADVTVSNGKLYTVTVDLYGTYA